MVFLPFRAHRRSDAVVIEPRVPDDVPSDIAPFMHTKLPNLLRLIVGLLLASGSSAVAAVARLDLPWPVVLENAATVCRVTGPHDLTLGAPARTDLYISDDGKYRVNKSPRLLFAPVGPFILTARIHPELKAIWDAGALMVFNDAEHFAKFCFERDQAGRCRVVSVVCNGVADDCSSMPVPVPAGAIYYRIVGNAPGNTFEFYASIDGKDWCLLRTFRIEKTDALRVGFSSQSPSGDGCTTHFSEISLMRRVPTDYWSGQ